MGRGRQRAKEKKVARKLKYSTPETDYEALQRELSGARRARENDDEDPYADLAALYNADFDDDAEDEEDDFTRDAWSK
ncbi:hypothetical protein BSR29_07035 [Boudabousia liubingyangii]|uniref:DUF3073 domain-containing protein n=1 Tax=Boudabousia liubingyangii TaxID=1921764 RepID=A0A1Q5PK55_9ACTO|nr:DUF3073 domain-containing protein [Boudabousia liubingyangii]OKL46572.1 hypothetical protein BSR29_07035 [Boudabousia liubingyangii]OKL46844.1 hypothetical protein BSR28_05255 [Boudabousia liubingyangii]